MKKSTTTPKTTKTKKTVSVATYVQSMIITLLITAITFFIAGFIVASDLNENIRERTLTEVSQLKTDQ